MVYYIDVGSLDRTWDKVRHEYTESFIVFLSNNDIQLFFEFVMMAECHDEDRPLGIAYHPRSERLGLSRYKYQLKVYNSWHSF